MIDDKLTTMKTELETVLQKERELEQALYQTKDLKLKYIGAIEVLEQMKTEDSAEEPEKKKEKVK